MHMHVDWHRTSDIGLCSSLNINMYIVYDNITTTAVPEPIPHPDPDIWQSSAKLLQGREDDLSDRMLVTVLLRHG
jgi:hypothetical protein